MGSWRQQSEQLNHSVCEDLPPIVQIDGMFDSKTAAASCVPILADFAPEPSIDLSLEHHVVSGLISEITWRDLHIELENGTCLGATRIHP